MGAAAIELNRLSNIASQNNSGYLGIVNSQTLGKAKEVDVYRAYRERERANILHGHLLKFVSEYPNDNLTTLHFINLDGYPKNPFPELTFEIANNNYVLLLEVNNVRGDIITFDDALDFIFDTVNQQTLNRHQAYLFQKRSEVMTGKGKYFQIDFKS